MSRRGSALIKVEVDKEDIEWYHSTYPSGTYSWLFTMLLKEFRKVHHNTPGDLAAIGAAELKKAMGQ